MIIQMVYHSPANDFVNFGINSGGGIVQMMYEVPPGNPSFLVIAPTRELAIQIEEEAVKFGKRASIKTMCCYGDSPSP